MTIQDCEAVKRQLQAFVAATKRREMEATLAEMTDDDYMASFKTMMKATSIFWSRLLVAFSLLFIIDLADMSDKPIELKALEECLVKSLVRCGYLLYTQG